MNTTQLNWRTPAADGLPDDGDFDLILLTLSQYKEQDGSPIYSMWYGVECYVSVIGEPAEIGLFFECSGDPVEGDIIAWANGPEVSDILKAVTPPEAA